MQENRHVNCNCHGTLSGKMKRLKRTFPEYPACFYFLFNKLKCTCHLNTNSMSCFATLIAPVTVFTNWWWMKPPPNSKCSTNRRFLVKSGFPPAPHRTISYRIQIASVIYMSILFTLPALSTLKQRKKSYYLKSTWFSGNHLFFVKNTIECTSQIKISIQSYL